MTQHAADVPYGQLNLLAKPCVGETSTYLKMVTHGGSDSSLFSPQFMAITTLSFLVQTSSYLGSVSRKGEPAA